jgi:hypothetical protein
MQSRRRRKPNRKQDDKIQKTLKEAIPGFIAAIAAEACVGVSTFFLSTTGIVTSKQLDTSKPITIEIHEQIGDSAIPRQGKSKDGGKSPSGGRDPVEKDPPMPSNKERLAKTLHPKKFDDVPDKNNKTCGNDTQSISCYPSPKLPNTEPNRTTSVDILVENHHKPYNTIQSILEVLSDQTTVDDISVQELGSKETATSALNLALQGIVIKRRKVKKRISWNKKILS